MHISSYALSTSDRRISFLILPYGRRKRRGEKGVKWNSTYRVTNYTNRIACCKTRDAARQSSAKVHGAGIERIVICWIHYTPYTVNTLPSQVPKRHVQFPAMRTDTTNPYTAIIPDMTTGMSDYNHNDVQFRNIDRQE